jgi:hypothetical protein
MRCKDIERLMIDASERTLSRDETGVIARHVSRCASCKQFEKDLARIRKELENTPVPELPEELAEKTIGLCRSASWTPVPPEAVAFFRDRSASIPGFVWAALILLVILTGTLLIFSLSGYRLDESSPFPGVLVLILIVQNAVMLFFVPVLIAKFRSGMKDFGLSGHENSVT